MDEPFPPEPVSPADVRAPAMPPLGPPYAPAGSPPPPTFPPAPPEEWPPLPPVHDSARAVLPPVAPAAARRAGDPQRRALLLAAIGAAAVVIVGVLAWGDSRGNPSGRQLAGATTTTEPAASGSSSDRGTATDSTDSSDRSSSDPQDLQATVLDIEAFVARERGLPFQHDVTVELVTDSELTKLLADDFDKERASVLESQQVLRATGMIPPTFDLVHAEQTLLDASVLGFYDPETKKLVVRGTEITPFVRETIAHELTHALDDQWFDLNRPQLDNADDESGFAFTALTEGDAVRVQDAYLASLSDSEQADAATEEQQLLFDHPELFSVPEILIEITQEPYVDGPFVVQDILAAGDQPRLDEAFRTPPTTSEQILDTQKFLDGEGAVPVATPIADAPAANRGVFGAYLLQELLRGSIPISEVDAAVHGWGGDQYVTWLAPDTGKTCLRDTFVGDTVDGTAELVRAVTDWADRSGATVDAPPGQPATFTICS